MYAYFYVFLYYIFMRKRITSPKKKISWLDEMKISDELFYYWFLVLVVEDCYFTIKCIVM